VTTSTLTSKELLQAKFSAPEELLATITTSEADAALTDLSAASAAGRAVDASATISVLVAARNAMQSEVIYAR